MDKKEIAKFTVHIYSTENATWQGTVVVDDVIFSFQSEMQLIRWLTEKYPELLPG